MGYVNYKGWEGETEFAKYLTDCFKGFKYKLVRIGGQEKNKKLLTGDVILDFRTDKKGKCLLKDYFLEAKKHADPNLFAIMKEAEKNASMYGKRGAIVYVVKQGKGFHRDGELIAMSSNAFKRLIVELQGFINEQQD